MGSIQMPVNSPSLSLPESSCDYLLQELKLIWDEVGQDELERERILLEIEQECVEVYRKRVDSANISRIRLHQAVAETEAEFTNLLLSLGERSFPGRPEKVTGTLKEQLNLITPALQEMQMRKEIRVNQFREVQTQIHKINSEIAGNTGYVDVVVNENDLSSKKLEEFQNELRQLHKEKSDRLRRAEEYIKAVCELSATMGIDSTKLITDVHPTLDSSSSEKSKNISDEILEKLKNTVKELKEEKQNRTIKLQRLGKSLTNLWNLMDTCYEDQQPFIQMTVFASSATAGDISNPGSLALDRIHQVHQLIFLCDYSCCTKLDHNILIKGIIQVESEVERLDQLKASKMKELFLRKRIELEEICTKSHMEISSRLEMENIMNFILSGEMDHADLLTRMEEHISKAKEEACGRKDIMEKVEKWMASCDEERWLEEYSRDENRYSVSRGAHKNLKRAERARIIVNKIPALVEVLMAKTKIWEEGTKKVFLYDEVPLLAMLEEYILFRKEKENEIYKQRERKRVQGQVVAEQENMFGSRPNTSSCRPSNRNLNSSLCSSSPLNKRLSNMTRQLVQNNSATKGINVEKVKKQQIQKIRGIHGHASHVRADAASVISATLSGS